MQVDVLKGVDGFAPAGTFTQRCRRSPVAATQSMARDTVTRVGLLFNWVPTRIAYVTDPLRDRIVALDMADDGTLFTAGAPREIRSRLFDRPVDLAAAVPEVASDNFSSNTTLGGGSDLYVLNRGNSTIVRITQTGTVVAVRRVLADLPPFRVNGLTVSEDAQTLWVTVVMEGGRGAVLQMASFGEGFITPTMVDHAERAGAIGHHRLRRRHVRDAALAAAGRGTAVQRPCLR